MSIIPTEPLVQSSDKVKWKKASGGRKIWVRIQASATDLLCDLGQAVSFLESQFLYNLSPFTEFISELREIMYKDAKHRISDAFSNDLTLKTNCKLLELEILQAIASGTVGSRGSKDAKGSFSFHFSM